MIGRGCFCYSGHIGLFGRVIGEEDGFARFLTKTTRIIEIPIVDNSGSISANNLARVETGCISPNPSVVKDTTLKYRKSTAISYGFVERIPQKACES